MRIILTGSRGWTDRDVIRGALLPLLDIGDIVLAHGDHPRGADRIGRDIWRAHGGVDDPFPVTDEEWRLPNRAGGQVRNRRMADAGADALVAFWDGTSSGTGGMLEIGRARRWPTLLHLPGRIVRWTDGTCPWGPPPTDRVWWAPPLVLF